jgi:rhodanese-related sulfurtransferase
MKSRFVWLFAFVLVLGMLLSACGGAAPTAMPEEVEAAEMEAPEVEESEPEPEPEPKPVVFSEADLDAAYTTFLADMAAYNTISLDALNGLLVEDPPFLLDVREVSELEEKGYIEGAVVIPLREIGQNTELLPSFDTTIVSYCGSGWRCTIALTALEALGWEDVLCLKGNSFSGWLEAGYPAVEGIPEADALNAAQPEPALLEVIDETLADVPEGFGGIAADALNSEIIENPDLILIDTRRAEEVEEKGMIEGAVHIPLESFIDGKADWPADEDAKIVVYCGSGHRSTIAMTILWSYGYDDVRSLKGGFGGWAGAGFPVSGGSGALDAAYTTFLADMAAYNTISLDALNGLLVEDPPFLLDVREVSELEEKGYIEGAVVIPLREIGQNTELLPSFDTTIVSYCGSGWRCTIALTALEALGWEDVLCLKGNSFSGWLEAGYPAVEGIPEADALNAAQPEPALLEVIDETLADVPEGFGGIAADALNSEIIENPDLILIDTRRAEEVEEKGMIEGAVHIPLESFIDGKADWPADEDAKIVVYCGSGHRSTIAMTILWSYGYSDVRSLKGGFGGWAEAGYPIVEYVME